MKLSIALAAVVAAGMSVVGHAAAPELNVTKSVTVAVPAEKAWNAVKDFDGLHTWHPAVAKDEITKGKNNEVGAERKLTLGDGGTIHEKLLEWNAASHTFRYSILEGVLPVSHYTSTVSIKADGANQSTVTWSGTFKRKDTGDKPAADANDETATTTMSNVYQAGLDNLKKKLEAK
ncbi:SRPBCC family protein [Dokdonella sp. MW10]|uniref:SRPBCC family protein n=1 Tax=Dokdonella sp. MW10 TaxID=2992926 RepID=UPI003F7EE1D7